MKKRLSPFQIFVLSAACFAICFLALAGALAIMEPDSPPGVARFHLGYARSHSKHDWLQTYQGNLWDHHGGYVPQQVQTFLRQRLEKPASGEEVDAIAHFYIRQARGREYGLISPLSEKARIRLLDAIFRRSVESDKWKEIKTMYLAEEVRRGETFGKGYFYESNFRRFAHARRGRSLEKLISDTMREWWKEPKSGQEKLRQDPLQEVGLKIGSL